jgi:hypothetical protein
MMADDHTPFHSPTASFPRYDKAEKHVEPTANPAQHEYHEAWVSLSLDDQTSFSSQDWTYSYNTSSGSFQDVANPIYQTPITSDGLPDLRQISPNQDVANPIHQAPVTADGLLDLRQISPNQEAANKVDVQSLIKPVAEGWRPPYLQGSGNVSHGYHSSAYARSTGVMTEPLWDQETCSIVGSDAASTFDSNFLSTGPYHNQSSFRQDVIRDDRSEISAASGARRPSTRPPAGRIVSDSQVMRRNSSSRRRKTSHPLPLCGSCKDFWPKNHSDQT